MHVPFHVVGPVFSVVFPCLVLIPTDSQVILVLFKDKWTLAPDFERVEDTTLYTDG